MTRYVWSRERGRWVPAAAAPGPRVQIVNRDAPFEDGIRSTVDGKRYRSRRAWDEHLRARGMVEIGNDTVGPSIRGFAATQDEGE